MDTIRYRISNLELFLDCVYGAEGFLSGFPEIRYSGVDLSYIDGFHYIIREGKVVHNCAFFSEEELQYMEIVNV